MEEYMKTATENIIKWLDKKEKNKVFGYYVDEESFRILIPKGLEEKILPIISGAIEKVPHIIGYNVWEDVTYYIFLNHPKLNEENLYVITIRTQKCGRRIKNL
jgi:hypothetical protein